jgi:uncharacterized protein YjbJ (UPF0337 family)
MRADATQLTPVFSVSLRPFAVHGQLSGRLTIIATCGTLYALYLWGKKLWTPAWPMSISCDFRGADRSRSVPSVVQQRTLAAPPSIIPTGTGDIVMNENTLRGNWNQLKGRIKQKWGELTDDDLAQIEGHRDRLVGAIQEKYGTAKEEIQKQVEALENSCGCCG